MSEPYPANRRERDAWVLARRAPQPVHDPRRPHASFLEAERAESGELVEVLTVLLVSRECPWRCVMCDLWRFTTTTSVPRGAIPAQLAAVLDPNAEPAPGPAVERARQIKLYNGGSFFDPRAIPPADYPAIAQHVCRFERVIVECHPALVGDRCARFRDLLHAAAGNVGGRSAPPPVLEVAMGLETAHPAVLEKLNKGMTLASFRRAAESLRRQGLAVRVFILVQPPFLEPAQALPWARRSLEFAFDCGATAAVLIPTRGGNGAVEALQARGQFTPPPLATLEAALDYGLELGRGRVLADLWDLERLAACPACFPSRRERLRALNLSQAPLPAIPCAVCSAPGPPAASQPSPGRHQVQPPLPA